MSTIQRPDAQSFINMKNIDETAGNRLEEYLPGTGPGGGEGFGRQKKEKPKKKWDPVPSDDNARPDEFLGSGAAPKKSWKVKSSITTTTTNDDGSDGEKELAQMVVTSPTASSKRMSWHPSSAKAATSSPIKAPWSPPQVEQASALKRTSWQPKSPLQPGPPTVHSVESSDPVKTTTVTSSPSPRPTFEKAHQSTSAIDALRPDVSSFIAMRHQKEGDTNKLDEYLPGTDPSGSPFGRAKKSPVKKWNPKPSEENERPDEWLGSPSKARKSWAPKSPTITSSSFKPPVHDDSEEEITKKSTTTTTIPGPPTVHSSTVSSPRPTFEKAHQSTSAIDALRPDVSSFIAMRHLKEGDTNKLDEYLPGTDPSGGSFGRQKKDPPKKKWNPVASDDNARPDEFLGSGAAPKKSWKVKSSSTTNNTTNNQHDDENSDGEKESAPPTVMTSPTVASKRTSWHPSSSPMKTSTSSPIKTPWSPPEVESSKRTSWQPKSPLQPGPPTVHAVESSSEPVPTTSSTRPTFEKAHQSTSAIDALRPDVSSFIAMRHQKEGDTSRLDEYLPGTDPSGSPFGRAKKSPVKKWNPKPSEENERPGEWLGSPSKARKSWAPKSPTITSSSFKPPVHDDSEEQEIKKSTIPGPPTVHSDTVVESSSDVVNTVSSPRPTFERAHQSTSAIDALRPDVSSFIAMRHIKEGDTNKLDEYLPGTDPSGGSFGRQKKEAPKKKWNPVASDDNARPDEFLGSGSAPRKSWKVKS